jgi:hypothetical protein
MFSSSLQTAGADITYHNPPQYNKKQTAPAGRICFSASAFKVNNYLDTVAESKQRTKKNVSTVAQSLAAPNRITNGQKKICPSKTTQ